MYVNPNFGTKKALKEAVASGDRVTVFQPNDMFGTGQQVADRSFEEPVVVAVEGPHYPRPHTWYAQVTVEDGIVTKVR